MQRHKILQKTLLCMTVTLAGGTLLGGTCVNTLASANLCGTVFPWCTPADQLNLLYPMLETPDFYSDPSCTIPLGCGDGDLYTVDSSADGYIGGDAPDDPEDDEGGGTGGGGGG